MNKKYLFSVIIIWVIVGGLFTYWKLQKPPVEYVPLDIPIDIDVPVQDEEVVFSTDKIEYKAGETIKMLIENNSDSSFPYLSEGGRFWELEYMLGKNWMSFDYSVGQGFNLTDKEEGEKCYLVMYERSELTLEPRSTISTQWNQKVCPYGHTGGPNVPKTVFNIDPNQYRFVFRYYPETQDPPDDLLSNNLIKIIYSNSFTIK